jgi:hypothetical protein
MTYEQFPCQHQACRTVMRQKVMTLSNYGIGARFGP